MPPVQLEQALKEYSHSITTAKAAPPIAEKKSNILPSLPGTTRFSPGVGKLDIGSSYKDVPLPEARALVDEMMLRLPEHREAALKEMDDLIEGLKSENPIEHHAKGWLYLEQGKASDAVEEFQKAFELDLHDPWSHLLHGAHEIPGRRGQRRAVPGIGQHAARFAHHH